MTKFRNDTLTTGLLYLALAVCGGISFLWIRGELFVGGDATSTLSNLVEHESLARIGLMFEMGLVVFQSLCAIWFWKLFRGHDSVAAVMVMTFGLMNAVVVIGSAGSLATALELALNPAGANSDFSHLLYVLSEKFWLVGNLFFGLWLIPMGILARRVNWGGPVLWALLTIGGALYAIGPLVQVASLDAVWLENVLVAPGTVGEIWMVGLLLRNGWRGTALRSLNLAPA